MTQKFTDKSGRQWEAWGDRILVQRAKAKTETASGLHVAERFQQVPIEGTVLACGQGSADEIAPGDVVLFHRHAGAPIPDDYGDDLVLLRIDEVAMICRVPENAGPPVTES